MTEDQALALDHENLLPPTDAEIEKPADEVEAPAETPPADDVPPTDEKGEAAEVTPEPDKVTALEAENAQLKEQATQRQRDAETQKIESQVRAAEAEHTKTLVSDGWDEAQAQLLSRALGNEALASNQLYTERKAHLADRLSREHGISMESLMPYNSDAEMRAAAQVLGPQTRRVTALEKELAQFKKDRIPAQNYNQPGSKGNSVPTTANEILTAIGDDRLDAANLSEKQKATLKAADAL